MRKFPALLLRVLILASSIGFFTYTVIEPVSKEKDFLGGVVLVFGLVLGLMNWSVLRGLIRMRRERRRP